VSNEIIRYYDSNTARFLKFGHGAGSKAIHRAVWAGGVETRHEAMNYVNFLIAGAVKSSAAGRVLDIGCGVGGSMLYLAERTSAQISGVTISPRQAEVGQQLIESAGCADRCSILAADFTDSQLSEGLTAPYDVAYAIESFLHMPDAEHFFSQAARLLHPGGTLLVCDDFLAAETEIETEAGKRAKLIGRFRRGWQVQSLYTVQQVRRCAEKEGLQLSEMQDLSPAIELNRPRDMLIRLLVGLLGWMPVRRPFWHNLLGGDSLQRLLLRGDIRYLLLRFEKK
jgi:cyclopropane fatty-acyl-phospholipid synthase-like methyltransferase